MKKIASISSFIVVLTAFLSFAQPVFAVEFFSGEEIYVTEPVMDDAYIGGGVVSVEKDIDGDLYVGGGSITINGNVNGDLVVAGGQVTVNGNVKDDMRVAGGSVYVNGDVGDDLVATSGQFNLGSDSMVGGTLILGTGYANILGTINEDVKGGGGKIVLGGTVYRDVTVEVGENITLTKGARINGNLVYTSLTEAKLDETQVGGFIEYNKQKVDDDMGGKIENIFSRWYLMFHVIGYISLIVLAFVLVLLAPASLLGVNKVLKSHPWKSLGIGFVVGVSTIAAIIIMAITIIGLPLAGVVLGLYLIACVLAKVYAASFIGSLLIKPKKITKWKVFGITALGGFILTVVGIVPFVGWVAVFVVFVMAFGGMIWHKKDLFAKLNLQKFE